MSPLPPAAYRFGPFVVDRAATACSRTDARSTSRRSCSTCCSTCSTTPARWSRRKRCSTRCGPDANVTDNALAQAVSELRAGARRRCRRSAVHQDRRAARLPLRRAGRARRPASASAARAGRAIAEPGGRPTIASIAVLDFANVTGDAESAWLVGRHRRNGQRRSARARALPRRRSLARDGSGARGPADRCTTSRPSSASASSSSAAIQRNGERIRITARVVDVVSGEALADAKVDGPLDDIFDLQDQVVRAVRRASSAWPAAQRRGGAAQPRDAEPRGLSRRSRKAGCSSRRSTCASCRSAIADFERAVAVDPRYALAYTGLASAEFALVRDDAIGERAGAGSARRARSPTRGRRCSSTTRWPRRTRTLALVLVSAWETAEAIARRAPRRRARTGQLAAPVPARPRVVGRGAAAGRRRARWRSIRTSRSRISRSAMVHVARGHLDATRRRVLRQGAAVQDRQIGRGERYPALGLHWLLGLVRLAQDDVEEALAEFERERALAEPHRLYGREYAMHAAHRPRRGAAARRTPRRRRRQLPRRAGALSRSRARRISGWPLARRRARMPQPRGTRARTVIGPRRADRSRDRPRAVAGGRTGDATGAADVLGAAPRRRAAGVRRLDASRSSRFSASSLTEQGLRPVLSRCCAEPGALAFQRFSALSQGSLRTSGQAPARIVAVRSDHDRAHLRDTLKHRGLQPFLWTQFLGAFNDNLFKIVVSMLAVHAATQAERRPRSCRSSARSSSCPFLLFSGYAGQLADVYSKRTVLVVTKSLEIVAAGARPVRVRVRAPRAHLRRAVPDRAAGDVLQSGEIRHPAGDAARPRPVARERRARDEHVRGDRRRHGDRQLHVRRAGTIGSGSIGVVVVGDRGRSARR